MRWILAPWWAVSAVAGVSIGVLTQLWVSSRGFAPFVPPVSYIATLVVLSIVVVVLGLVLRRAVRGDRPGQVNPFHAVRLLVGARAAQLLGALSSGIGVGMCVHLMTRTVIPGAPVMVSVISLAVSGLVLLICGALVERWCQVPPDDDHGDLANETEGEADPSGHYASEH